MGPEWLTQTEEILKGAGFRTEAGYPAHKAAALTDTVAAVNLCAMDEKTVRGILVTILTPRKMGLEVCQSRAADALQALAEEGNLWSFDRWRYEEGIDCWAIEIHGIPAPTEETLQQTQGYSVTVGDTEVLGVTDFLAQQMPDRRMTHPHWSSAPSGVIPGKMGWILKLTQLLPWEEEEGQLQEPFSVTVCRGQLRTVYSRCYRQSYSVRLKQEGTEVIRGFYALSREVSSDGENAV